MFKLLKISLSVIAALAANTYAAQLEQVPLDSEAFVSPPASSMPGILWFWHSTPMTTKIIETQMNEMHAAGFRGIMMFPLASTPKYYTEEFYELFEDVLRHAEKLGMSIWLTNDQAIPTGHGAMKVVPGGKIHDGLTLEPRPDLRAEKLLHVNVPVTGGRTVNLTDTFPGYHDIPPTITFHKGEMNGRATEAIIGNKGGIWRDYKYQVDITPLPWSGNPLVPGNYTETGWIFRADKATTSGYAWVLSDRTNLGKGVPALKRVILEDGKVKRQLPPVKLPFEKFEEKPYRIQTVMLRNRIETFIDGVSVDVLKDDTYWGGTIGFYLPHPCRGRYDEIKVLSMSDGVIYEDNCDSNANWRFWGPSASVDEVFSVAAVAVVDGKPQAEGILDLTDVFAAKPAHWHAPAGEWSIDYFMKRKDFKQPYNYPDLYHPDVIKRHLQITYGEIVRRYPWAIGSTFKGFWSDEPHTTASKGKAWSAQFEKNLLAGGHKIGTTLAAVYNDFGRESRRLRAPYYQQAIEGWTETFARLQGEWCKSHGLDFMTNPVIDSSPPYGALSGGNGLQMNQWSNVPGVDAIYGQIMPGKRSLISRWATSSAHQEGNQHVLYEVFGGYGWDVTPDIVRYVNGNLMVRGANRASYHAYWTNPDVVGYAPPFDPSNTWWSVQDELNLWNGRLQEMNLGKAISNVGLMNPTSTLYADEMNLDGRLMNPAFTELFYLLEDNQVCFDLVDETSLNDNPIMRTKAVPVHGGLQLGHQRYNLIIVPRAHTLSLEVLQTLEKMVELGGVVIATHLMPEEELEGRDEELKALLNKLFGETPSEKPHHYGRGWTAFVKAKESLPPLFERVAGPFGHSRIRTVRLEKEYPHVRVLKRERENAIVYLLMNEGEEAVEPTVSFYEDKMTPEIWDPETGSQMLAPVYTTHGEWGVHVPLELNAYQTKVVVFKKDAPDPSQVPHLIAKPDSLEVLSVKATGEKSFVATVLVETDQSLTLEGSFNGWRYSADLDVSGLPQAGKLESGWELRFLDDTDKAQQINLGSWTNLRPNYSGTASYAMSFTLPAGMLDAERQWHLDLGTVKDVVRVEINGQMLEPILWAPYTQDLTPYLKAGENKLKVLVSNTLANKHGQVLESGLIGPVTLTPKHYCEVVFKPVEGAAYRPVVLPKAGAQPGEPLTTEYVYRKVGDADLKMKVWYPPTWKPDGPKLPTTVFIFGGGWYLGGTSQFNVVGPYLAKRGMIVLAPEYRTERDGMLPDVCLEDSKSAMRYIYKYADELGVDSARVAAGGISAGGHLAAATAFSEGFNAAGDDLSIPVKPKALVLFAPVIDNGPGGFRHVHVKDYWEGFSPLHNIAEGAPPTIFVTGDVDEYTPIETARRYKDEMDKVGGRCDLLVLEGGTHAAPLSSEFYNQTISTVDAFLVEIGFLKETASTSSKVLGQPDVAGWIKALHNLRTKVAAKPAHERDLEAKKSVYRLSRTYPILTDWILQDATPSASALMIPEQIEGAERRLLAKLGVTQVSAESTERLSHYVERCLERREQRLRPVLDKWAPFAFTETHSNYATFIAYTEGLSDARFERFFKPGSRLSILDFDAGSTFGEVEHLIDDPHGMLRDVDLSMDAKCLLFAWKKSDRLDDYHIYEYDLDSGSHRQLTYGLGRADYEPIYLPGGDIIFASTRPEQSVPCWWNEISNLYRMDSEGRYIRRLAVDQVQAVYPQILNDGQICYTRWDYSDRGQVYPHPLFSMKPDGREQRAFYGGNSWFPTSLLHARPIPDSGKVMAIAAGHHTQQRGKLVVIDVEEGRDEGKGMQFVAPVRDVPYERVDVAQQHGDQFRYPFPLSETELLVTYVPHWGFEPAPVTEIEKLSGNNILKDPAAYANRSDYGLYWMNIHGERELLYKDPDLAVQRPVALGHRVVPTVLPDAVRYAKKTGTYYVHDVYQGVGLEGIPRGEAKTIRVVRLNYRAAGIGLSQNKGEGGVSMNSTPVSIGNGTWDIKEILGDVEIEPDGSALFEVPADESIYLQVLNARGEVIQTTRTWDTVRPGENKSCVGCHVSPDVAVPSAQTLATQQPPQKLKPFYGETRGFSFQKEIQPILDQSCVSCHDGSNEQMDLRGEAVAQKGQNKRKWTRSYINLTGAEYDKHTSYTAPDPEGGIVSWISKMSVPTVLPPYFAGAAKSPLLDMLDEGHHDVKLSEEEYHKFAAWMDLLVPFSGEYREGHDWAPHEMAKYDYYEEKRRQQALEEKREIAEFVRKLGAALPDVELQKPAAFTTASYDTVWEANDHRLAAGEGFSLPSNEAFVFDRIQLKVQSPDPLKLELRSGAEVVHTFELEAGKVTEVWHAGDKVLHSGSVSLIADKSVTLSHIQLYGVGESELPEFQGYRPHLNAR